MRKGANRFARGMNKTLKGASKKFGVLKKPGMMRDFGYENAVVGGGLASAGMAASKKAKQEKVDAREQKVEDRRDYKLDKIEALEEKSYAVAAKRKWLAIIMALGLVIYFVVFKGGFSFGGIGSALKGLF